VTEEATTGMVGSLWIERRLLVALGMSLFMFNCLLFFKGKVTENGRRKMDLLLVGFPCRSVGCRSGWTPPQQTGRFYTRRSKDYYIK
jgi:hypothetical protein